MKMMHVTIQTQNFNEEIKFYQEGIGLSIQHEMNGMGRHIVFLGDNEGGMPIEIINRPDAENIGNQFLSMGYKTEDVVKMRETLIKKRIRSVGNGVPYAADSVLLCKRPAGVTIQFM